MGRLRWPDDARRGADLFTKYMVITSVFILRLWAGLAGVSVHAPEEIFPAFGAADFDDIIAEHWCLSALARTASFIYFLIHLFIRVGLIWTRSLVQLGPWSFNSSMFETGDG